MPTVWFVLVAFMLVAYVVLDGFDLGAGAVHLFIARTDAERRTVLRSIGPVWDGNEVWLIAVGVEFRTHIQSPVLRGFFDGAFGLSSALLAVFFGAALGNVIRGVPLRPDGSFFEPLWTDFRVGTDNGILDWYTVLCGVLALVALTVHGASWVTYKTEGAVQMRARKVGSSLLVPLLLLAAAALVASLAVRPQLFDNYRRYWLAGALIPAVVVASYLGLWVFSRRGRDRAAFLSSCAFLAGMLGGVAFALHPRVLPASTSDAYSLTIYNTAAGQYSLRYGVYWWSAGMLVAIGYFVLVYRMFRGKVRLDAGDHGY